MRNLMIAAIAALSVAAVAAQGPPAAKNTYKVPRTADGQPDFQGYWTNLTYTPYERPKALANKPFYTEKEAIDAFNKAVGDSQNQVVHYVNTDFGATPVQTGAQPNLRTSLVIAPADGRIPPLTPEAQKREAARTAAERGGPLARTWRDDRGTVWCVFHDRVVPSVVAPYGSNYHVVQSKDTIVMTYEWNSEHRVIPLDGRPHGPVPSYIGDSRGHWEGDTLVIDTIGLNDRTRIDEEGITHSDQLHVVEHIRKVDGGQQLESLITITDPVMFTKPWTTKRMYKWRPDVRLMEYACEENNRNAPVNGVTRSK
jgi:hypothetical protein